MMESSEVVQRPETSKADIKIFTPAERIHQLNEIDKARLFFRTWPGVHY
jgi:hypothetical protein